MLVRDIYSLIEYIYLKTHNPELLNNPIIVNPTESDITFGSVVIINNDSIDKCSCKYLINRRIDKYDYSLNLNLLPIILDTERSVYKEDDKFFIHQRLITKDNNPAMNYLRYQISSNNEVIISKYYKYLKLSPKKINECINDLIHS